MPLIPFGEYRPDVSDLNSQLTAAINGVLPRADGYGPFRDVSAVTAALPAVCRGFFVAYDDDGTVAIFAGTSINLYKLDNSDFTWDDVSIDDGMGSPDDYSALSANAQWQFAQYGLNVIAVQANAAPQVYTLGSSTLFANLGGSPPQAAYVSIVGSFLVLSGLLNAPFRVQWSDLGDITEWSTGSADEQDFPDGGFVQNVAGGEYGIIFQETAIRHMTFVPGSTAIFEFDRIAKDEGLYAPYSMLQLGSAVYFLSRKGFQRIIPGSLPTSIGREKVDRTFFNELDETALHLVIGASDPRGTRAFWTYKSDSGAAGMFDKMLCYDTILDRWTPLEITGEYLASLVTPGLTLENLDSISASLDALGGSLDDYSTATLPLIASATSAHKLGTFSGDTLEATLESPEQGLDGRRIFVRGFRPVTDAPTLFGSVGRRENLQTSRTYSNETAINSQGFCPARVSTRYARGKIRIPAGTDWTFASGIEPNVAQEGMR